MPKIIPNNVIEKYYKKYSSILKNVVNYAKKSQIESYFFKSNCLPRDAWRAINNEIRQANNIVENFILAYLLRIQSRWSLSPSGINFKNAPQLFYQYCYFILLQSY